MAKPFDISVNLESQLPKASKAWVLALTIQQIGSALATTH
jgi:hypothetical protein